MAERCSIRLAAEGHGELTMVAEDFLQDQQVRQWLNGVEPAWTLLTFDSLRALRWEPSARQNAIRVANDLSADESAGSAVTRNTLMLLRQAIERGGLPLTATGNLSRAAVAEMRGLIEWPHYDQADAFRLNKVINEPDFLPLHVVRILAQAATLVRAQRGRLVATPLGKSMLSDERRGSLLEPISKSSEEDNEAGELDKAEEVLSVVLPADEDATLPLYPGEEALDEPASHVTV